MRVRILLGKRVFQRVRPLPGNLVEPLPGYQGPTGEAEPESEVAVAVEQAEIAEAAPDEISEVAEDPPVVAEEPVAPMPTPVPATGPRGNPGGRGGPARTGGGGRRCGILGRRRHCG